MTLLHVVSQSVSQLARQLASCAAECFGTQKDNYISLAEGNSSNVITNLTAALDEL